MRIYELQRKNTILFTYTMHSIVCNMDMYWQIIKKLVKIPLRILKNTLLPLMVVEAKCMIPTAILIDIYIVILYVFIYFRDFSYIH